MDNQYWIDKIEDIFGKDISSTIDSVINRKEKKVFISIILGEFEDSDKCVSLNNLKALSSLLNTDNIFVLPDYDPPSSEDIRYYGRGTKGVLYLEIVCYNCQFVIDAR